jgi:hypothetical protein
MTSVIADVSQKTTDLETKNRDLLAKKTKLEKKLEIKSGRLEFILDEKENLFAKLQKIMELNQQLKKKQNAEKPKMENKQGWFKGGWFSGVKNYFKKKDLETIDVSGGKVRKNIQDDGQLMGIDDQLENSTGYFTNQTDKDILELRKKRNEQIQAEKEKEDTIKGIVKIVSWIYPIRFNLVETKEPVQPKMETKEIPPIIESIPEDPNTQSLMEKMRSMEVVSDDENADETDSEDDDENTQKILEKMREKIEQIHDEEDN